MMGPPVPPLTPPGGLRRSFRRTSGKYYGGKQTAAGYPGLNINTLYLWPVFFEVDELIDRIAFISSLSVAGNAKFALYRPNDDASDGTLLAETATDASTAATGLIAGSLSSSILAPAGMNFLGACFSAAAQTSWAATGAGSGAIGWLHDVFGDNAIGGYAANAKVTRTAALTYVVGSAFMPATLGGITIANAVSPNPVLLWRAP